MGEKYRKAQLVGIIFSWACIAAQPVLARPPPPTPDCVSGEVEDAPLGVDEHAAAAAARCSALSSVCAGPARLLLLQRRKQGSKHCIAWCSGELTW